MLKLYVSPIKWDMHLLLELMKLTDCGPNSSNAGCFRCCQEVTRVRVMEDEITPIARYLKKDPKRIRREWRDNPQPAGHNGEAIYHFSQPCQFLTKEGCSIYPVRPRVCRLFPLYRKDPEPGEPYPPRISVVFNLCNAGEPCVRQLRRWEVGL